MRRPEETQPSAVRIDNHPSELFSEVLVYFSGLKKVLLQRAVLRARLSVSRMPYSGTIGSSGGATMVVS